MSALLPLLVFVLGTTAAVPAIAPPPPTAPPKPPRLKRLAGDSAGLAYWSPTGDFYLAQSRDGRWLVKHGRDGRILGRTSLAAARKQTDFDLSTGRKPRHGRAVLAPNGKLLALAGGLASPGNSGGKAGAVWLLDVATGAISRLRANLSSVVFMSWAPDGKELVLAALDGNLPRFERLEVPSANVQPISCPGPVWLTPNFLDDSHLMARADQLYAVRLDCSQPRPLVPFADSLQGQRPLTTALSPKRIGLAVEFESTLPGAGNGTSLWAYSRDDKDWKPVLKSGQVGDFAWLDDDTLVYELRSGAEGGDSGLGYFNFSTGKTETLLLAEAQCTTAELSASPKGNGLTFQRTCKNGAGWMGLVTPVSR
jgi:hypothetical protein